TQLHRLTCRLGVNLQLAHDLDARNFQAAMLCDRANFQDEVLYHPLVAPQSNAELHGRNGLPSFYRTSRNPHLKSEIHRRRCDRNRSADTGVQVVVIPIICAPNSRLSSSTRRFHSATASAGSWPMKVKVTI